MVYRVEGTIEEVGVDFEDIEAKVESIRDQLSEYDQRYWDDYGELSPGCAFSIVEDRLFDCRDLSNYDLTQDPIEYTIPEDNCYARSFTTYYYLSDEELEEIIEEIFEM